MRLVRTLIAFCLLTIFAESRSITPMPTTTIPTTLQQPRVFDSIRYKVADNESSQIELVEDSGEEEESVESTAPTTIDPAFLELSRQAFLSLNQGVKPAVVPDEDRRINWLNQHQRQRGEGEY
jgi:hypothetical protein